MHDVKVLFKKIIKRIAMLIIIYNKYIKRRLLNSNPGWLLANQTQPGFAKPRFQPGFGNYSIIMCSNQNPGCLLILQDVN